MQIVRIFPNNKHKCHFSIRKHNNRFFVYEGDKVLRTDLPSVNSAETEISLIVLNRKKSGATEIPVKYGDTTLNHQIDNFMPDIKKERNHTLTPMSCATCNNEFMSKRSNHLTCSRECSIKFQSKKKNLKRQYPNSQKLFCETQQSDKTIGREGFEKGVLETYDTMGIVAPKEEALNEFHELTEKEMRLSLRKKKVEQFAIDIVDYVITWCELNEDKPFSYHTLFNEMLNYKIVDLNKKTFINVFAPVMSYEDGILQVSGRFDFSDSENLFKLRNRLTDTIFEENAIPTEEQYTKVAVIRLMTSQLRFFQFERNRLKQEKPQPVSNAFDTAIFQGVLDMINSISKQNSIIGDRINQCLERQNAMASLLISNTNEVNNDLSDLKISSEKISKQVEQITKKRRGLFG
jgi:hypothetical protein